MTNPLLTHKQPINTTPADCPEDIAFAARNLGLKPVRAWVPNEKKSRTSEAERTKRSRANAATRGLKQLSVTLPAELHPMVKTLAARTKAGETVATVLIDLLPGQHTTKLKDILEEPMDCLSCVLTALSELPGWRRWLVYRLLAPALRRRLS